MVTNLSYVEMRDFGNKNLHSLYETADNPNAYAFVEQVVIPKRAVSYELWCRDNGIDPVTQHEDDKWAAEAKAVKMQENEKET